MVGVMKIYQKLFLFVCILMAVGSCDQPKTSDSGLWSRISGSYQPKRAQRHKDINEAKRLCFSRQNSQNFKIEGEKYSCYFKSIQVSILKSIPNLKASIRGQCPSHSREAEATVFCQIENGSLKSVAYSKRSKETPHFLCKNFVYSYKFSDRNWRAHKVIIFDFGYYARNLVESDDFTLDGIVVWGVFDPEKSRPEERTYLIVDEERNRFSCTVGRYEVKNVEFREVGTLTPLEEKKMFSR